jgi:hypothetical protein
VGEGVAGEVVVDEGGLGADGPQAVPEEDEDVRVLAVDGDNVLWLDAVPLAQPGAVLEDLLVDLGVGVRAALEDDEGAGALGLVLGVPLQNVEGVQAVGPLAPAQGGVRGDDGREEVPVVPE